MLLLLSPFSRIIAGTVLPTSRMALISAIASSVSSRLRPNLTPRELRLVLQGRYIATTREQPVGDCHQSLQIELPTRRTLGSETESISGGIDPVAILYIQRNSFDLCFPTF